MYSNITGEHHFPARFSVHAALIQQAFSPLTGNKILILSICTLITTSGFNRRTLFLIFFQLFSLIDTRKAKELRHIRAPAALVSVYTRHAVQRNTVCRSPGNMAVKDVHSGNGLSICCHNQDESLKCAEPLSLLPNKLSSIIQREVKSPPHMGRNKKNKRKVRGNSRKCSAGGADVEGTSCSANCCNGLVRFPCARRSRNNKTR